MRGEVAVFCLLALGACPAWAVPADFPPCALENGVSSVKGGATGFFHVEQAPDGRWWAIDPNGRGVVLLGVNGVKFEGQWCEALGYRPYLRNNLAKYATEKQWEEEALGRLKGWGFNMLSAWSSEKLWHRGLAHAALLRMGLDFATDGKLDDRIGSYAAAFPNVFSPRFAEHCQKVAAARCAPNRNDPWLVGYFIDNELPWWGKSAGVSQSRTGLFDAAMRTAPTHSAKKALRDFLAQKSGNDLSAFNAFWGQKVDSFDNILALTNLPHATEAQLGVKREFLCLAAEKYFSATTAAIRSADPNHMVLGSRFASFLVCEDAGLWEAAGKYCDVVTFNCYPQADLDRNELGWQVEDGAKVLDLYQRMHRLCNRPMMVTEWAFRGLDAGHPCFYGAGQNFPTQRERAQAMSLFVRTMLSCPFLLGYSYFTWLDQPPLGVSHSFKEDANYGLVNEDNEPYAEFTEAFARLQKNAVALRFQPPPAAVPFTPPVFRAAERAFAECQAVRACGSTRSAAFTREKDGSFALGNGPVRLEGKIGGSGISLGRYGSYNAMLHLSRNGHSTWMNAAKVIAVEGGCSNGLATVDVTFAQTEQGVPFEIVNRLYLPPAVPWFLVELRSVKNTGTAPLVTSSAYFRLYPPFSGAPRKKPAYWGRIPQVCWLDNSPQNLFIGLCAPRSSGVKTSSWVENGIFCREASCPLPKNTVIAPGGVYQVPFSAFFYCAAGEGGEETWDIIVKEMIH